MVLCVRRMSPGSQIQSGDLSKLQKPAQLVERGAESETTIPGRGNRTGGVRKISDESIDSL